MSRERELLLTRIKEKKACKPTAPDLCHLTILGMEFPIIMVKVVKGVREQKHSDGNASLKEEHVVTILQLYWQVCIDTVGDGSLCFFINV